MPLALKLNRHKTSTFVGLDIQPGYVAAVQARVNGEIVVERAAGCPLPADTVREGEVLNQQALSATLRDLFDGSQLDRRVRVGIANQRTVLECSSCHQSQIARNWPRPFAFRRRTRFRCR